MTMQLMGLIVATAAIRGPVLHQHVHGLMLGPGARATAPYMKSGDIDMHALAMRINQLKQSFGVRAIIMNPGCLLPSQRMKLRATNKAFADMLSALCAAGPDEERTLALMMLSKEQRMLPCGVEVCVESVIDQGDGSWKVTLLGDRIVQFMGALDESDYQGQLFDTQQSAEQQQSDGPQHNQQKGWFMARVHRLDLPALDKEEVRINGGSSRTLELASREIDPLVECWKDLVKRLDTDKLPHGFELSRYLDELGPLPAMSDYSARAIWVACLINPGPTRVAPEVRPQILIAETALQRLYIAKSALVDSIRRLKGAKFGRPFFED